MKVGACFLSAILAAAVFSGGYAEIAIQAPAGQVPTWGVAKTPEPGQSFQFAIMADRTGGQREGIFPDAVKKINLLRPQFVLCVGDLIEGYTENAAELAIMYEDLNKSLAGLESPFFFVPGNHDLSNDVQKEYYAKHRGPAYYNFVYKNVLFLCLSSEDGEDGPGPDQLAYIKKVLAEQAGVRWTFLFLHRPLWRYGSKSWGEIESALGSRAYTVFAGHEHTYMKFIRHDRDFYMLGTTGGASDLNGADSGRLDHIVLVTMGADKPTIASLAVEGIMPDDFVDEERTIKEGNIASARPIMETLLVDTDTFEKGKSAIRFSNAVNMPAKVTAFFPPNLPFAVEPQVLYLELIPKEKRVVDLTIRARQPMRLDNPLFGFARVDMQFAASDRIEKMTDVCQFAIDRQFWCEGRESAVVVDGDLGEWSDLPFVFESDIFKDWTSTTDWGGPEDCSGRFAVAYDEAYLYFAARVRDAEVILNPEKFALEQDGVGFFVDLNPTSRSRGARMDLAIGLSPGQPAKNPFTSEVLPETIKAVCKEADGGYVAEIAIPIDLLNQKQGGQWSKLRANVAINDVDGDGRALLWWRPAWDSQELYPDSGLFLRK